MSLAIIVWPFAEAPEEYRALSKHGGDEDWLAVVPFQLRTAWIPWLEEGSFGCCEISKHELPDGQILYIGAHS